MFDLKLEVPGWWQMKQHGQTTSMKAIIVRSKKEIFHPATSLFGFALVSIWSILFWAVKIPWLSLTFPSFPWPMLSSCSQSIVKAICYLKYFYRLTTGLSVIISTFDLFAFLFSSLQLHDFPGLENEITKFNEFQVFPDQKTCNPWVNLLYPSFFLSQYFIENSVLFDKCTLRWIISLQWNIITLFTAYKPYCSFTNSKEWVQ